MSERPKGRQALGKGLGALIPGAGAGPANAPREFFHCAVDRIRPQPGQARRRFDKEALEALVETIREVGMIQPLVVRRTGDGYELIAGERRWRAAQLAGLAEVPVVIKDVTDSEAFVMGLIENLHREDLNPIEEAEGYSRLIEEHGLSQADISAKLGRDRSTVSNSLRLLKLPEEVRALVIDGDLSEGHARALLQAPSPASMIALARKVVALGWSVRVAEREARGAAGGAGKAGAGRGKKPAESAQVRSLSERLERALGARVRIDDRKGHGTLRISYTSYEELDGILDRILR
ncbi:MAG TPA: ParB/RepB/Spo0J family partition protein [Polyangia bacterium]|nr:ParB/RepB/Spo0J family partition protein [Polyangia bacterium]